MVRKLGPVTLNVDLKKRLEAGRVLMRILWLSDGRARERGPEIEQWLGE